MTRCGTCRLCGAWCAEDEMIGWLCQCLHYHNAHDWEDE